MPVTHRPFELVPPCATTDVPALFVKDLSFTYPDGHVALKNVSFCVEHGEKVVLVGPNGAGKSTLILHLNGILQGQKGEIKVYGMEVEKKYLPLIRAQVGLVFQNPDDQLFSPTVFEDVAFGPLHMGLPEDEIHERVGRALQIVGMGLYKERLSHHLSFGEKKRIAIATVLSMQPSILVLDEPSANLDPRARRALINLLGEMNLTLLVSTHDMLMVRECFTRMIVMDDGWIVADGLSEEILSDHRWLAQHGLEVPC
ncbi:MAG: ABC transporter ATP-binding protein [Chloroflexota bacterium]